MDYGSGEKILIKQGIVSSLLFLLNRLIATSFTINRDLIFPSIKIPRVEEESFDLTLNWSRLKKAASSFVERLFGRFETESFYSGLIPLIIMSHPLKKDQDGC